MTTTINASPTNGLVQTADGSGVLKVQSNGVTTNALAWVNFNGTGTVAIRASYNVSSITDNGTGSYTINFANALSDANYVVCGAAYVVAGGESVRINSAPTTTSVAIGTTYYANVYDSAYTTVAIFGN